MGALHNRQHERFCDELSRRLCEGEKSGTARTAAYQFVYGGNPAPANARRLANRKAVRERLSEKLRQAADLADVDRTWCILELKRRIGNFNLDDYLTPPNAAGERFFNVAQCSRDELGRLSELSMEEEIIEAGEDTMRRVRKVKLKPYDPIGAINALARIIPGIEAPQRRELTGKDGKPLQMEHRKAADLSDDQLAAIAMSGEEESEGDEPS